MELNIQADMKTKNGKKLKVKTLVDSGYTCIVKNIDDGLQFLFPFSFYLLSFFISCLFSIFRTRVRV